MAAIRAIFVFVLVIAAAMPASAQTLADINKLSGLDVALGAVNKSFAETIDQIPGEKPEQFIDAWKAASADAFAGPKMLAAIEARMEGKLSAEQLAELYKFYSSDFGRKMSAVEVAAVGQDEEIATQGAELFAQLPQKDPERLALYQQIIDGLDSYTVGESISLNVGYGVISGMMAAAKQPATNDQIKAILDQGRADMRQEIEEQINFSTAWTYRDVSLDDLKTYAAFLETPAAKAYYGGMITAMDAAFAEEAKEFGNKLFEALGMKKA